MAAIVLRSFRGMAPSANAKAIDPATAIYANNLDLRFGDLRPMPVPANVATGTAGGTLYKFESAETFITRPGEVNFVRGPIPTDITERTYYTGDGAPKVTDLTAAVRQLGVPRPAAAPTVTLNVSEEFSTDDSAKAIGSYQNLVSSIVWSNRVHTYVGVDTAELAPNFIVGGDAWSFNFVIAGTIAGGVFSPTNAAHRNLMDDRLGFFLSTVGGITTGYVAVLLRGAKLTFMEALATDLGDIADPSDATGVARLLTTDQITAITDGLTNALKPADTARDATITRIKALKAEFVAIANTASASALSNYAAVQEFYVRTEVDAEIDAAVEQAVSDIYGAMFTYNASA